MGREIETVKGFHKVPKSAPEMDTKFVVCVNMCIFSEIIPVTFMRSLRIHDPTLLKKNESSLTGDDSVVERK